MIGNYVRVGQTVQFHVRDAVTAAENLVRLLEQDRTTNSNPPQAALLFSCNGRGTRADRRQKLHPRIHRERSPV